MTVTKVNKKGEGESTFPQKIIILGLGNELMSDEGIGVHAAKELQKKKLPPHVEVIEGGTDGFGLLNIITATDYLIIIDTLKGGDTPGTIYRFNFKDAPECPDPFKTSIHQIGILEVLNLSGLIGKTPETVIFGIEPKQISMGMELSPSVKNKIPRLLDLIMEEVKRIKAKKTPKTG